MKLPALDLREAPSELRSVLIPLSFTVYGRPQQRGSKSTRVQYDRSGKPVAKDGRVLTFAKDDNPKSTDWMQQVRAAAASHFEGELLTEPIELTLRFYFSRPKSHYGTGRNAGNLKQSSPRIHAQSPDLAKLIRCAEDALTGVVWRDDRQVFRYGEGTQRFWTTKQERMEVVIHQPCNGGCVASL